MRVVGALIRARREQLWVLTACACVLIALVPASAPAAVTARAKGLDVSTWNGTINWTKVAGAGYTFAFGKATEGTSFADKTSSKNARSR